MKIIKKLVIVGIFTVLSINTIYAYDLCGESIWIGGVNNQYSNMSYGAVADYSQSDPKLQIKGYGRYQFYYKTNLIDFLSFVDSTYFNKWINFGSGSNKLNDYSYGLPIAFTDYYNDKMENMKNKQDEYIYTKYYLPMKEKLENKGVNLDNYDEYLKGAVLSFTMYNIDKNEILQTINDNLVNKVKSFHASDNDTFITNIYNYLIEINQNNTDNRERFVKEKRACLEHHSDEFNSKIGEILNSQGTSTSFSLIRDINNANPNIFKDFLQNKKFSEDNIEWYNSIRQLDFKKEIGITSGVMDFGINTSRGYNQGSYESLIASEVCFTMPNSNCPIYYIPQNFLPTMIDNFESKKEMSYQGKQYALKKFGANNIAQSGGSVACLSMAINKFFGRNASNLSLPDKIVEKIEEMHNGDYNYYYDEEKKGQKNEIITDVAREYGLTARNIAGSSIISSLSSGGLVIARVSNCEFTKWGNFVLIGGYETINGENLLNVFDPNIHHANFLYKLYDVNYLINDCSGIFFELKMN